MTFHKQHNLGKKKKKGGEEQEREDETGIAVWDFSGDCAHRCISRLPEQQFCPGTCPSMWALHFPHRTQLVSVESGKNMKVTACL